MQKFNTKRAAVYAAFCAGIIGIIGIFLFFKEGSLVLAIAPVAAVILLLNLILYGLSYKFNAKWLAFPIIIVNIAVSVGGLVYAVQDMIMFYHVTDPESREFLQNLPDYREIMINAGNGKTYYGMLHTIGADTEKAPTIIYFGGNGEVSYKRMRSFEDNNRWRYFEGYNFIYVDYEGYGLNGGKTSYTGMYEESLAVYDWCAAQPYIDETRVVSMGYSIGTGAAVYLAANRPVAGLILAAPYANGYDLYNAMLPIFKGPLRLLVKQRFKSDEYARYVTCPVMIIASRSDETVPYSSTQRLSAEFPVSVGFFTLETENHNSVFTDGTYQKIKTFLEGAK